VRLTRPAVVVELRPEPTIAVDARNGGLGDLLAARLPGTRVARDLTTAGDAQLVVVLQDAHRHEWQREAATKLVAAAPDAIVVEVGLPVWRPDGATGYVATHGAAKVNVEAAVDRLLSG
jgi:beta-N-acetylhexosaminidase